MHPLNRQIQNSSYSPRLQYQVEVTRGDVLYVPPYWLHQVEALTDSISVNSWCPSEYSQAARMMQAQPLPFDEQNNIEGHIARYVRELLHGSGCSKDALAARFSKLSIPDALALCGLDDDDAIQSSRVQDAVFATLSLLPSKTKTSPQHKIKFECEASEVEASMDIEERIGTCHDDGDAVVGCLLVLDHIEEVVAWVAGPSHLFAFLQQCVLNH